MLQNNWLVRLPSGSPVRGLPLSKLPKISRNNPIIRLSEIYRVKISIKISWSMEWKNFLMSHFNTQQVWVLLQDTWRPKSKNRFIAQWVPFPNLHEKESAIKVLSKNGYKIR